MFKKIKILKSFIETKEFKDEKKLKEHQRNELEKLQKRIEKNEFYKNNVGQINKKNFMENFEKINTCNINKKEAIEIAIKGEESRDFSPKIKDITIGLSSGTSGNRGIFLVSEKESAIWAGYILKRMLPKPYIQKHKIAFFLRANSNLYESIKSKFIEFSFFDLINPIEEHIHKLNELKPTILIGPAQLLKILSEDVNLEINPKKIISVAEVLEDNDKEIIEKRFNQIVHQIYQCTEGFLGHTCEKGNLHLNEDIVMIEKEWIDKDTNRFSPVITDFKRTSQPIVNYKLDDILILEEEKCECGSVFTRIKKIEGRCDDILKMKTKDNKEYLLFPDFIRNEIIKTEVKEYNIIKEKEELNIFIEPLELREEIEHVLHNLYKKHNLKSLKHNYFKYERSNLDQKRRRVKEI